MEYSHGVASCTASVTGHAANVLGLTGLLCNVAVS